MTPEQQKLIAGRDKAFAAAAKYGALKVFTWRKRGTKTVGSATITPGPLQAIEALVTDLTVQQIAQLGQNAAFTADPGPSTMTVLYTRDTPPDAKDMLVSPSNGDIYEVTRTVNIMQLDVLYAIIVKGVSS